MNSLYFLIKSLSSGESPNLSNMNSDFTSETTVRNIEIPSSIFVILVAARWMFAYALASNTCSETTNMPYWGQWLLCCGWRMWIKQGRGFGDRSWCLLLTREWLGIGGWFDLTILYWSKKKASILLFNLYNFNLNVKHLFTIISEQAEIFYSLPQIPATTI